MTRSAVARYRNDASGRPVAESNATVTRSGRIQKQGGKKGGKKVALIKSYKVPGAPDPKVLAKCPLPGPPKGGFKRPIVRGSWLA
jgi:hypothetical protein